MPNLWEKLSPRVRWLLLEIKYSWVVGVNKGRDFLRPDPRKNAMVRGILGVASIVFALACIFQPGTFDRPNFYHLKSFLGFWDAPSRTAEWVWAGAFLTHALGLSLIAIYEPKKDTLPVLVGSFGLSLWMISSLALNWAVHAFSPGVAMEVSVCAFGTWALYTTEFGHYAQPKNA